MEHVNISTIDHANATVQPGPGIIALFVNVAHVPRHNDDNFVKSWPESRVWNGDFLSVSELFKDPLLWERAIL